MSAEIEIVSDENGALILGDENAIQEFSAQYGLSKWARRVPLDRLSRWLYLGTEAEQNPGQFTVEPQRDSP